MTGAAPTILALETDSAWMVILAVSIVTLPAALLLRRLINRPGGLLSGLLLLLPLALPPVAALVHQRALLPEVAVLRPAKQALASGSRDLLHLLYLSDGQGGGTFYALIGSAGPWFLFIGLAVSSFMLLRRAVGMWLLHRLITRCRPVLGPRSTLVHDAVREMAVACGLKTIPEVSLLPAGVSGAFAVGARRGRILISVDLVDGLDPDELTAILAHEVAHLAARDVLLVFTAGLLRDMIAWNPVAHLAYRRLTTHRELEADRTAAALTADPLAVASGLLKMYELVNGRRATAALAFLRPGGRISRRVSRLIDAADGRIALFDGAHRLPYLFAACAVAVLGLQAGAQIAADRSALAIVWGAPSVTADLYPPKRVVNHAEIAARQARRSGREAAAIPSPPLRRAGIALRNFSAIEEQNIDEWMTDMTRWTQRQARKGLSPLTLRWEARLDWTAVPIRCAAESICLYRINVGGLLP